MVSIFHSASKQMVAALERSLAVVEFDETGVFLRTNENFCRIMGYRSDELVGKHHSVIVDPDLSRTPAYQSLWSRLAAGDLICEDVKRIDKSGSLKVLKASYSPVMGSNGKVAKIVKFVSDITDAKLREVDYSGQLAAISRARAVIQFKIDGTVLTANQNFLDAVGYKLDEIVGRNHSIFIDPSEQQTSEYKSFWQKLARGEPSGGEIRRIGKNGRVVYLQANYNPIFDDEGRVIKVVKFATDVSLNVGAVQRVAEALEGLSNGDLIKRIDEAFIASLEPVRRSYNVSAEKLQKTLLTVRRSVDTIITGAEQMRLASDDLASRSEEEASALQQTSASLSDIAQAVIGSSRDAEEAGKRVGKTRRDAETSGTVVAQAIEAMTRISNSSAEIGKIIGVIDEIAFQTNLLALNAGVEAARAGEAGRGFAVVAQEVRGLAQRSAEAAKEIKKLISTSGEHVDTGVDLVGATGKALELIVAQVGEIDQNVAAIVTSSRSQATGLSEISATVAKLDNSTRQNAAMVEQSRSVATALASEAGVLDQAVSTFKLGQDPKSGKKFADGARQLQGRVSKAFG